MRQARIEALLAGAPPDDPTDREVAALVRALRDLKRGRIYAVRVQLDRDGEIVYAEETHLRRVS